jgi:hypothetical protein
MKIRGNLFRVTHAQSQESFSLILPYANEDCMNIFMEFVSEEFKEYRIIMGRFLAWRG